MIHRKRNKKHIKLFNYTHNHGKQNKMSKTMNDIHIDKVWENIYTRVILVGLWRVKAFVIISAKFKYTYIFPSGVPFLVI